MKLRKKKNDDYLEKDLDNLPELTEDRINEFITNTSSKPRKVMNPYKIYNDITKEK